MFAGFTNKFAFSSKNDHQKAEKTLKEILDAIEKKDKEAFKAIFSKNALHLAENTNESLEELFALIDEEVISWDDRGALQTEEENNYDGRWKYFYLLCDVKTKNNTYFVFLHEYVEDTRNPDNIGLQTFVIMLSEKEDEKFGYYTDWTPGIHVIK
jgi:hypothetical protein